MPNASEGRAALETLEGATKRYRLRDPSINNATIADVLGLVNEASDFKGTPACCFYRDGYLCAVRTRRDQMVVFHLFGSLQNTIDTIGDRVLANEPEESRS
jgi:hypothetical protein